MRKFGMKKETLCRLRRKERVRKRIRGSVERPRLSVFRSLRGVFAQLVDDMHGETLVAVSTHSKNIKNQLSGLKGKKEISKALGKLLAERAKARGITQAVFDRGGNLFHGRIKALADGAREGGLIF
jgi:large subunit ribosomal protein L18